MSPSKKERRDAWLMLTIGLVFLAIGIWMAVVNDARLWTGLAGAAFGLMSTAVGVIQILGLREAQRTPSGSAPKWDLKRPSRRTLFLAAGGSMLFAAAGVALVLAGLNDESTRRPGPVLVITGILCVVVFGGFALIGVIKGVRLGNQPPHGPRNRPHGPGNPPRPPWTPPGGSR